MQFDYTIRRSDRAKKTRIIVTPHKIEVVAPRGVSDKNIQAFVKNQQDWIISTAEKLTKKHRQTKKLAPNIYSDGVEIPFHGNSVIIKLKSYSNTTIKLEFNHSVINLLVPLNRMLEMKDNSEQIRLALISGLKKQACVETQAYIELHAKKQNLYPRSVKIKTQKSRWGSCGIHNDINLNWLLILAPPKVMEYVVVHEICHIKERNHSAKFWQLVESHLPDYKKQRLWLKQNGGYLMQGL